jgi:hypothetical protein
LVVSLGFDLTAGVGVGFNLAAGVGDRFGCGLLGWVWEGMGRKMVLIKKSFLKKIIILF